MHIYLYGSASRGEATPDSDIDLLAILASPDARFDPTVYSVYAQVQLRALWAEGNPFAWHLAHESRLIYTDERTDYLSDLGLPRPYRNWATDRQKFRDLYAEAVAVLSARSDTTVFELGMVFLAVRNLAICYSLAVGRPVFSRRSFLRLGRDSLNLDDRTVGVLEGARILSTRGYGQVPTHGDVRHALARFGDIDTWIEQICGRKLGVA